MKYEKTAIVEETVTDSSKLYVMFGGIAAGLGIPPFEFYKSAQILDENKIFVRDLSQTWYQNGLPGIADNACQLAEHLGIVAERLAVNDIYFIGNSMGGYAAILIAALLRKGKAIAFSPQTFISFPKRVRYWDMRWNREVCKTYLTSFAKAHYYDLRELLQINDCGYSVEIHTSRIERKDLIHAKNLGMFTNVTIHEYCFGGHDLVRRLRDKGTLASIIRGSCQ